MKGKSPFFDLHHVGWVVKDIDKAISNFEAMGLGPFRRFSLPSKGPGHDLTTWEHYGKSGKDFKYEVATAEMGPIKIELFQCISGDSIPQRFIDAKGEGIWHMSYVVTPEEYDKALADMLAKGFKVIGSSKSADGVRMAYFDTDKFCGVIFQLHDSDAF